MNLNGVVVEPRAECLESIASSPEPGAESREPGAESLEPRAEGLEPRANSLLTVRIRNGCVRSRAFGPACRKTSGWDEPAAWRDERREGACQRSKCARGRLLAGVVPYRADCRMLLTSKTKPAFHTSNVSRRSGTSACGLPRVIRI